MRRRGWVRYGAHAGQAMPKSVIGQSASVESRNVVGGRRLGGSSPKSSFPADSHCPGTPGTANYPLFCGRLFDSPSVHPSSFSSSCSSGSSSSPSSSPFFSSSSSFSSPPLPLPPSFSELAFSPFLCLSFLFVQETSTTTVEPCREITSREEAGGEKNSTRSHLLRRRKTGSPILTVPRDRSLAAGKRSDDEASDREGDIASEKERAEVQSWENPGSRSFRLLPGRSQGHKASFKGIGSCRSCPPTVAVFCLLSFAGSSSPVEHPWKGDDDGDDRLFRSLCLSADGAVDTGPHDIATPPATVDLDGPTRWPEAASMRAWSGQTVLATTLPRSAIRVAVPASS